jgi:hypothetical protein
MEFDLLKADGTAFIKELSGPESQKLASDAGLFVAQKLRERAFSRQILTPTSVGAYDLQVETIKGVDQMYYVHEKEVNVAPAAAINFKGEPDNEYIVGERYRIYIFEIASRLFQKKEIELLAYRQPIIKLIEDNTVREIEEVAIDGVLRVWLSLELSRASFSDRNSGMYLLLAAICSTRSIAKGDNMASQIPPSEPKFFCGAK